MLYNYIFHKNIYFFISFSDSDFKFQVWIFGFYLFILWSQINSNPNPIRNSPKLDSGFRCFESSLDSDKVSCLGLGLDYAKIQPDSQVCNP